MDKDSPNTVEVLVFGAPHLKTCSGCNAGRTMAEMAYLVGQRLVLQFGSRVNFTYVDATTDEMGHYPEIARRMKEEKIPLPLSVVDGEMVLPGMFSPTMITYKVKRKIRDQSM